MTITTLDPRTALIIIDLQKGVVALSCAHPMADVVKHVITLASAFRKRGLPVVLVNVAGVAPGRTEQRRSDREYPPGWTDLIPELNQQPQDLQLTKRTPGAFTNTGLGEQLTASGVTQVVIAGVATSNGVEATARQAYELGFNIAFATDAMTDRDAEAHHNSVTRIFPRIGETGTSREIVDLLERSV
ncbi:isochorismatase family protein [Paludibacterium yongneupense]|uniref:isochorismatase family protein n=1 Tax=Paludibacterium yongneupense TaxID=400061 RepID=UPI000422C9DA|nr:isochorismatase family protein [Paludibacterium yongneupense]